ncbi:MAG: hypothetical protein K8R07_04545 [Desulfobacterales bacterium]|nr:hypothetical protein [Desulfobacterales bacterium]
MRRVEVKIINDDEFNHLRSQIVTSNNDLNLTSQIVMSNDNLNLKSQFATLEKWDSIRSQNATIEGKPEQRRKYLPYAFTPKQWIEKTNAIGIVSKVGRYGGTYGIAKCDTFKAVLAQQVVSQLIQIPWGQNITKNLPDEFRYSLPSIEEIEAELGRVEESQ